VTLPLNSDGEWAGGSQSYKEACWKLKLHSGSTHNHENEGKTDNLGWMLYLLYTVFGVCCIWCMLYLVYAVTSVCCIQC